MPKAVFYQSIGPELSRYDIDVENAALTRRETVTIAGANVQYVWPHPSRNSSTWCRATAGLAPFPAPSMSRLRSVSSRHGRLRFHGGTARLPSRPVHCSVDRSGHYLLTAYNYPSNITVHRIEPDGTLGDEVSARAKSSTSAFSPIRC